MSAEIPTAAALRAYLLAIAGREPPESLIELRPLHPDGRQVARAFLRVGELAELERRIQQLAATLNVYVGVAPRTRPEGHAGAVARVWTLAADLDTEESLRERLPAFRPAPAILLDTGSPGHGLALWPQAHPLAPAQAQRANRRLALALGGDMAATDPARIFRPPGTLNHKHDPPAPVRCTRLTSEVFTARQVVGGLPDSHHYRPRPPRPPREHVSSEAALDALVRTVREAANGERNARAFWACCAALRDADDGRLDEHQALEEIRAAARETGLPEWEVGAVVRSAQRTVRGVAA